MFFCLQNLNFLLIDNTGAWDIYKYLMLLCKGVAKHSAKEVGGKIKK